MMKSPAMAEALKPLNRLDARAREDLTEAAKKYTAAAELHVLALDEAKVAARKALRSGHESRPD